MRAVMMAGVRRPGRPRCAQRRTKTSREANFRSSIYRGKDGYWHGRVTVGARDDGTPDRRHVMSRDKAKVTVKVRQLERQRENSAVLKPGQAWSVDRWLTPLA